MTYFAEGMEQDKINAYMTLYTSLVTLCKVAAPMIPFMTEEIYLNIVAGIDKTAPESIHLCDFPVANEAYIDKELEANMDEVLRIVVVYKNLPIGGAPAHTFPVPCSAVLLAAVCCLNVPA